MLSRLSSLRCPTEFSFFGTLGPATVGVSGGPEEEPQVLRVGGEFSRLDWSPAALSHFTRVSHKWQRPHRVSSGGRGAQVHDAGLLTPAG